MKVGDKILCKNRLVKNRITGSYMEESFLFKFDGSIFSADCELDKKFERKKKLWRLNESRR